MTHEERIYLSLKDLQDIELRCPHCETKLTWPIRSSTSMNIPDKCPNCNKDWFLMHDPRRKTLGALVTVIRDTEKEFKEDSFFLRFRVLR